MSANCHKYINPIMYTQVFRSSLLKCSLVKEVAKVYKFMKINLFENVNHHKELTFS